MSNVSEYHNCKICVVSLPKQQRNDLEQPQSDDDNYDNTEQ